MNNRQNINILKEKLSELEKKDGFDKTSPFYLALKEKIDNLDKVITK